MIKKIVKCKSPEILVITPLKMGSKVSKETKKSIKRNKTPFEWISYMGNGNAYQNMEKAYKQYMREHEHNPKYVIKVDNDINVSRYWLDKMYNALEDAPKEVAYAYTAFEFQGHINARFNLRPFKPDNLRNSNYISSCSLMKTQLLDQTGCFITDNKFVGLLDWALWLNLLNHGFIGIPVEKASFIAQSSPDSVSCWPNGGYQETHHKVIEHFVK